MTTPPAAPPSQPSASPYRTPWYQRLSELRTSEGRLTILAQVFLTLNTAHVWSYAPPRWTLLAQALVLTGYQFSRGWAKRGTQGGAYK